MDVPPKAESQAAHIWESALEQSEGKMIQTIHTTVQYHTIRTQSIVEMKKRDIYQGDKVNHS